VCKLQIFVFTNICKQIIVTFDRIVTRSLVFQADADYCQIVFGVNNMFAWVGTMRAKFLTNKRRSSDIPDFWMVYHFFTQPHQRFSAICKNRYVYVMYVCSYVPMYLSLCICYVCICSYVAMYLCTYVPMYLHIVMYMLCICTYDTSPDGAAQWSSHSPEEQMIRVRVPQGCKGFLGKTLQCWCLN
jgi:hypothetical protein